MKRMPSATRSAIQRVAHSYSADISVSAANIACFISVQCLFFLFIASRKYLETVKDKTSLLKPFVDKSNVVGKRVCAHASDFVTTNREEVKRHAADRFKRNRTLIAKSAMLFVLPIVIVSVIAGLYARRAGIWQRTHSIMLLLAVLCFSTELVIFVVLFQTYVIVGDYELLYTYFTSNFHSDDNRLAEVDKVRQLAKASGEIASVLDTLDMDTLLLELQASTIAPATKATDD